MLQSNEEDKRELIYFIAKLRKKKLENLPSHYVADTTN